MIALAYLLCVAASIGTLMIALRRHPAPKPTPAPAKASLSTTNDAEVAAILAAVVDLATARLTPAA